jgi:hypothetical protein
VLLDLAVVAALVGAAQDIPEWPDDLVLECRGRAYTSLEQSGDQWRFVDQPLSGEDAIRMHIRVTDRIAEGWSSNIEVRSTGIRFGTESIIAEDGSLSSEFPGEVRILGAPDDEEFLLLLTSTREGAASMQAGLCRRVGSE